MEPKEDGNDMKQRERSKDEIPFSEMTPAQKRSYLWDYWRMPALAVLIAAVSLIALIHTMFSSKNAVVAIVVNADHTETAISFLNSLLKK